MSSFSSDTANDPVHAEKARIRCNNKTPGIFSLEPVLWWKRWESKRQVTMLQAATVENKGGHTRRPQPVPSIVPRPNLLHYILTTAICSKHYSE